MEGYNDPRCMNGGNILWECFNECEGYRDITLTAAEVLLEEGLEALMKQLDYSDIEHIRDEYPTVYAKAIELAIITEED